MDEITKQITEMADKMEKSTIEPKDGLFKAIKALGPAGLKEKLATLSDDEKIVLKAALEEMTLQKAVEFDKEYAAKMIQGKVTDTIIQEDIASDDADEKLMKPAAAVMNHQGTPTDGWEGQVIKSIQENPEQLDLVIEKAMEKCKDDKMVMKKLKEKGMDEGKVQGALDKYKAKQNVQKSEPEVVATETPVVLAEDLEKGKMKEREQAKEKIMQMEEKEHGTKDPKKVVAAEKKENKMQKSISWDDDTRLLKANTLGRNHTFNVEQFITETLASEGQPQAEIKKSEGKEDINDIIAKGGDTTWNEIEKSNAVKNHKTSGQLIKSFDDVADIAAAMGISVEEAKKILGE